jgi:metal transporter CNNM
VLFSELIGEEIYDEFDPQGARGDPYEVPPAKDVQSSNTVIPNSEVATAPKPQLPSLPVLMPTALKNFGGLGFLRSRSAPPVPRDIDPSPNIDEKSRRDGSDDHYGIPTLPRIDTEGTIEMPKPVAIVERQIPSVVVEPYEAAPVYSPAPSSEMSPGIDVEGKSKSLPAANLVPGLVVSPTSRTASPAPLEAVLLDRKRRLVGTASAAPSAIASTASLSGNAGPSASAVTVTAPARNASVVKGTKFKSSPLGGGQRAGVVVAEKVKEDVGRDAPEAGTN